MDISTADIFYSFECATTSKNWAWNFQAQPKAPGPHQFILMMILFPFSSLYTLANNDFFAKKGSKKIIITDKHEKLRLSGPEKYKICKNVVPKIWAPSRFNWEPAATLLP